MPHGPISMEGAREMGVPECFSDEYAFHEARGTLPPYNGPVYPDYGSDAAYLYRDEPYDPADVPAPEPCQGPPPTFTFLGMPPAYRQHEPWCWERTHDDACPPPF